MRPTKGREPMTVQLSRLGPHMGIAAEGVDLATPPGSETVGELRRALLDGLVLCIRGCPLPPDAYVAAMAPFGTPRPQLGLHPLDARNNPSLADCQPKAR